MVKRRDLLLALGASALASPLACFAQRQPARIARIGYLGPSSATAEAKSIEALRAGLRDFGYVEGSNLVLEMRWAEGITERLPDLAAELVRLKVDVLVTHSAPGITAARRATTTIPIVMAASGDPVAAGHVASLARPAGNVTGLSMLSVAVREKEIELLKEAFPATRQIAYLINPENSSNVANFQKVAAAARVLKVDLLKFEARTPKDLEDAFSAMASQRVDAVMVTSDPMLQANIKAIAALARKQRLPSIGSTEFADADGLMGHGVSFPRLHRRAAYFVDRILKGAKPGDLPVEQPTKLELVINLKTAKALGITIPHAILLRADRVIE